MKAVLILVLSFFLCDFSFSQHHSDGVFSEINTSAKLQEQYFDFEKLHLNLSFDTKETMVYGNALYQFTPLRNLLEQVYFDAPNITIKEIKLDNNPIDFEYVKEGFILKFIETLNTKRSYSLEIVYETQAQKGIYFLGWNDPTSRARKQIWTQGQGRENIHWIPGFDLVNDKLITETTIVFESGYEVISNGKLVSKLENDDNTTTWSYAMSKPHALNLLMVAIGEYDYKDYVSRSDLVSRQYFYKDKLDAVATTFQYSTEMMNWYEAELGVDYQWGIYKNIPVVDLMYGAVENTTATIFTDFYLQTERETLGRNYVSTNAHELAHHWFGNFVSAWSADHHWLQESFASHYAKHFMKQVSLEDDFHWQRYKEHLIALKATEKDTYAVASVEGGAARHYAKGSAVLDMLRNIVGDEDFKKTITAYLINHAFDKVDTHDFKMEFRKTLGMDLSWFFDQWIYNGGEPEYQVNYKLKADETVFTVAQIQNNTQNTGLFKMPISFEVHYKDGSFDAVSAWLENEIDTVIVPNSSAQKVNYVLFDPNDQVLKKVNFDRTYQELLMQASEAKNMLDRLEALNALKETAINKKRDALIDIYLEEAHSAVKINVLQQLEGDKNAKTTQLFVYAMGEKDVQLRKAALQTADISNKRYLKFYEELLEDKSYNVISIALAKLCYEYPDNIQDYLNRVSTVAEESVDVKLAALKITTAGSKKMAGAIVDFSSESFEFRTRIKAIEILQEREYFDQKYIKNLLNAYSSFNRKLSYVAEVQLRILLEKPEQSNFIAKYIAKNDWLAHEKLKLKNLIEEYNTKVY